MHKIVLDGKCDTMDILVETGIFWCGINIWKFCRWKLCIYIYICTSSPYTMKVETIIYVQIISHGERVVNVTYLKKTEIWIKMVYKNRWY